MSAGLSSTLINLPGTAKHIFASDDKKPFFATEITEKKREGAF
jgi:hypothetical protein